MDNEITRLINKEKKRLTCAGEKILDVEIYQADPTVIKIESYKGKDKDKKVEHYYQISEIRTNPANFKKTHQLQNIAKETFDEIVNSYETRMDAFRNK
jgi:hypothetical protein